LSAVVKYGPLLLWHMIPQKSPPHMSFIWASWKDSWVSRKVLILTAYSAKQVRCLFFSFGSDASYDSGTVYSLQTILFLRKLCGLTFVFKRMFWHVSTLWHIIIVFFSFWMLLADRAPANLAAIVYLLASWKGLCCCCFQPRALEQG